MVTKTAGTLDFTGAPIEALVSEMLNALSQARKVQQGRTNLDDQIGELERERTEAQLRLVQAEQTLNQLIALAHLTNPNELESVLLQLEQRERLRTQITQLRSNLVGLAGGATIDDFIGQVRAQNPEDLQQRRGAAERGKEQRTAELNLVSEKLYGLTTRKRQMEKAGDAAASFRQQAESCAARLRQDAARYLRLRLAIDLLEEQIERFRKENQGPLLQKSGEVFSAMTRGAFSGLAADFNADEVPILVGLRSSGKPVPVKGLSDGTRDQLYLALRLAALDRHLQEHEPMPLILDDLLITFDDDRVRAILPQLAALAKRTQIFLFIHHTHLVNICRETLGAGQFQEHTLTMAAAV